MVPPGQLALPQAVRFLGPTHAPSLEHPNAKQAPAALQATPLGPHPTWLLVAKPCSPPSVWVGQHFRSRPAWRDPGPVSWSPGTLEHSPPRPRRQTGQRRAGRAAACGKGSARPRDCLGSAERSEQALASGKVLISWESVLSCVAWGLGSEWGCEGEGFL